METTTAENTVNVSTEGTAENTTTINTNESGAVQPADDKEKKMEEYRKELLSKDANELVEQLLAVNKESKTRKFENRELQEQIKQFQQEKENFEKLKQAEVQKELEKNQKWEEAYNNLKEQTAGYDDLKNFKMSYLNDCKQKIDNLIPTVPKAELELFELSADGQPYDKQLKILEKMINSRIKQAPAIDNSQSTHRLNGANLTKEDLLKDTNLMAKVKKENPSLYDKFFGIFKN